MPDCDTLPTWIKFGIWEEAFAFKNSKSGKKDAKEAFWNLIY